METGSAFRERREAAGITQEQVAAKAGMSSATVRKFEAGSKVRVSTAREISGALTALTTEVRVDRARTMRNKDDVAQYLLSLPDGEREGFLADLHAESARRVRGNGDPLGE